MKAFVVVMVPAGVFIHRTDSGRSVPRNRVVSSFDTYEEARVERDKLRGRQQQQREKAADKWHWAFNRAMDRGDMATVNRLCGLK